MRLIIAIGFVLVSAGVCSDLYDHWGRASNGMNIMGIGLAVMSFAIGIYISPAFNGYLDQEDRR